MTNITPELLRDLREKASAATPGPWGAGADADNRACVLDAVCLWIADTQGYPSRDRDVANAEYIAAANPDVVLALLDRIHQANVAMQWALHVIDKAGGPVKLSRGVELGQMSWARKMTDAVEMMRDVALPAADD